MAGGARRAPGHRTAMGKTHTVRFEPVGIEMEADEDETILNAAFRQGIMLMHGCKEGQCSACKSFLLDGEVDLDRYSTFALPDFEEAEGWTLLCRAHAYSDLEVELINYDEEALHGGTPPRTVSTIVEAVEPLTADIWFLKLAPEEPLEFKPGQYVDIAIPGTDEHRSFSMANTDRRDPRVHDQAVPGRQVVGPAGRRLDQAGRPAGGDRPLRGLHAAAQLSAADALHRRWRRHGADPLAAALDEGERGRARGGLLLRRAHRGRPLPPGGAGRLCPARSSPRSQRTATAGRARWG